MLLVLHKHAQYLLYHFQPAHKPVEVDGNGNEQLKHEVGAFLSLLGHLTSFQRKYKGALSDPMPIRLLS